MIFFFHHSTYNAVLLNILCFDRSWDSILLACAITKLPVYERCYQKQQCVSECLQNWAGRVFVSVFIFTSAIVNIFKCWECSCQEHEVWSPEGRTFSPLFVTLHRPPCLWTSCCHFRKTGARAGSFLDWAYLQNASARGGHLFWNAWGWVLPPNRAMRPWGQAVRLVASPVNRRKRGIEAGRERQWGWS